MEYHEPLIDWSLKIKCVKKLSASIHPRKAYLSENRHPSLIEHVPNINSCYFRKTLPERGAVWIRDMDQTVHVLQLRLQCKCLDISFFIFQVFLFQKANWQFLPILIWLPLFGINIYLIFYTVTAHLLANWLLYIYNIWLVVSVKNMTWLEVM